MFWCSLVRADRPPKEAMPVAIACLAGEDLDLVSFAGSGECFVQRK